jgi:ammonia channel protein AmtB
LFTSLSADATKDYNYRTSAQSRDAPRFVASTGPEDCFSLHGVGGFAGAILGGFFDMQDGLIYGGGGLLLGKNLAGAAFGMVYSAAVTAGPASLRAVLCVPCVRFSCW